MRGRCSASAVTCWSVSLIGVSVSFKFQEICIALQRVECYETYLFLSSRKNTRRSNARSGSNAGLIPSGERVDVNFRRRDIAFRSGGLEILESEPRPIFVCGTSFPCRHG